MPDFVVLAGPLAASWQLSTSAQAVSNILGEVGTDTKDLYIRACNYAEVFLRTWRDRLPFGRPLREADMGLRGDAAIVGIAEYKPERKFTGTPSMSLEQWADLAASALDDAGIDPRDVNGVTCAHDVRESSYFIPATVAEYCGFSVNFAERLDLGGASPVGMVWRAAAAIELGICDVVVGAVVSQPRPPDPTPRPPDPRVFFGASSNEWGSPQAEFEIPYGNLAQNCGYAMIAQRYGMHTATTSRRSRSWLSINGPAPQSILQQRSMGSRSP